MTDTAPRSWRSIIFRPGRPPMRPRTAVLLCLVILLVTLVVDVVLLTNSRVLGRIAAVQIRKHAGEYLKFESLTMTLGGQLKMDRVRLRVPDPEHPILEARRVRVSIGHRGGGVVAESILLEDPRIRFSDQIARDLGGKPGVPRRPLSDFISSRHLPRISCRSGTLELGHSEVLAGDAPQVFEIIDLAMVPTTGYRYFVRGTLRNGIAGDWSVQGEVDLDTGDHRVHLSNPHFAIGPALRDALHPKHHEVVDKYGASGPAGADVFLARDQFNPSDDVGFRLTLKPKGLKLRYELFPYPVDNIHGEIDFRADGFTVKHIAAENGRTKIRFDGSADGYEADAGYHFRLEFDDLGFDDALKNALEKDTQDVLAQFKPSGRLDARATIHRERGGPEVKESMLVDLHLKGASLLFSGFPYAIDRATGEIRIDGDNVIVKRLQAWHGKTELRFAGRIDSVAADPDIDLDIRALSMELDGRLRDALPPEARDVFDRLGVSGDIDLDLRILKTKGGEPKVRALIRAKENRILLRDAPLPIVIREGTVEYNEGRIRLHHLKGLMEPAGEIDVSGEINPGPEGSTTHIEIDGIGVPIDDRLRDKAPKTLREALESVKITGIADFKFTLDERPERDRTGTRVRLQLDLRKGVIASDVPVEDIDGTVVIVGPIRDGRPMLSGRIDVRSARIAKKQIRNLRTNITIQGAILDFRDIGADAYGGKVAGWFSLDTVTNDLEGDFSISQLDLKEFINDTAKWSGKTISGKVDLHIPGLRGKSNDIGSLTNGNQACSLSITEGQLLDVPGIVRFLNPLDSGGQFTAMRAFFDIRNSRFDILEFAFLGKKGSGSIIGKGRFEFDGKFKLKIRTETGSFLGFDFFIFKLPGAIFDFIKTPLKVTVEGDLESSKILD